MFGGLSGSPGSVASHRVDRLPKWPCVRADPASEPRQEGQHDRDEGRTARNAVGGLDPVVAVGAGSGGGGRFRGRRRATWSLAPVTASALPWQQSQVHQAHRGARGRRARRPTITGAQERPPRPGVGRDRREPRRGHAGRLPRLAAVRSRLQSSSREVPKVASTPPPRRPATRRVHRAVHAGFGALVRRSPGRW